MLSSVLVSDFLVPITSSSTGYGATTEKMPLVLAETVL